MDARRPEAHELRRRIEWALARALDPGEVLPLLHRLARMAGEGSEESQFANQNLAELLVERDPWRAALFARRVLAARADDDRGWATLALCQTLLGHYKYAATAYRRAIAGAPKNPWYAHNLGHLLDVALDRPEEALAWLRRAHQGAAQSAEVASSYAHALARAGRIPDARRILTRAMKRSTSREHAALLKWVELGAPRDKDHPLPRPAPIHAMTARGASEESAGRSGEATGRRTARSPVMAELDAALVRGMASLPLDARQRARAKALARDAMSGFLRPAGARGAAAVLAVAAAVAYAIVYVDHVPLTQAEVASCFRVSVASMRGRFGELRATLDLLPGDVRYATVRQR